MFATALAGLLAAQTPDAAAIDSALKTTLPPLFDLYRWLHENPELSTKEEKTASRLADEMKALGLEVTTGVGGTGILGILKGAPGGPTVLFRADMDALPVTELTGLPYASKNPGVMHACGHDIHMSSAVGTMSVLSKLKDRWKGTVLFVGQPAEELGAGAAAMLKDPKMTAVLKKTGKPKVALCLHDSSDVAAGTAELATGWSTANVDSINVTIHGKGGHGARPHLAVDPIVIGSEVVLSLQTIISRRIEPGTRAVITVGEFNAGTKHNIIPPTATLLLTVRSYGDDSRKFLLDEIKRTITQIARAHGAPKDPEISWGDQYTRATYNDPAWAARLMTVFQTTLGKDKVTSKDPTTGGEDFGEYAYQLKIPGVMWWVGAQKANAKKSEWYGIHSDHFAPDPKPAIETGVRTSVAAILEALRDL